MTAVVTIVFHSFNSFGKPSKGRLFMGDAFKWAPAGFATWYHERDQSPGMVKIRENKKYVHEVAAKLIKERRQEIKDGTSQKDVLTLLSASMRLDAQ